MSATAIAIVRKSMCALCVCVLVARASSQPSMMMARMAMISAHSMLFSLVCPCECVLYPIRQPVSSVVTSPHPTDIAFTSAMANRVIAFIGTLDSNIPACAPVPHCDLRVARVRLVADGDCLDDVFHCVALVVVVYVYYIVILWWMSKPKGVQSERIAELVLTIG